MTASSLGSSPAAVLMSPDGSLIVANFYWGAVSVLINTGSSDLPSPPQTTPEDIPSAGASPGGSVNPPADLLAAMLLVAMAIPALMTRSPLTATGDLIAVIYLFALTRFFFALSGVDSGSMFAGIGAGRETTLAVLNEPVMVLSLFVVALLAG